MSKKGILVVSFGTSYGETRKLTILAIENKIRKKFKEYEVRRAFTSKMIINKLKKRDNLFIDNTEEALEKMAKEGFEEVIVQSLHIIPGEEYDNVKLAVHKFKHKNIFKKLILGKPLLFSTKDYFKTVESLKSQIPILKEDEAVLFMGHGTTHPANSSYALLQYVTGEMGILDVYIANVEGFPELEVVLPRLKAKGFKKIILMPFMIVAGDHANNDMASKKEDSWKSILEKNGFEIEVYLHGIGENSKIQDMFIESIQNSMNKVLEMEKNKVL